MAKCASRSVVKGCRTRRGSPVLKLWTNPEIERPAILKTSRPGVPGRVGGVLCSVPIESSQREKKYVLSTMFLFDAMPFALIYLHCTNAPQLSTDTPQLAH